LLATPVPYPPIADLAKPMLRLAGLRIDPTTNGEHHAPYWTALSLKKVAGGSEKKITLPPNARPSHFLWSADGKSIAFANTTPNGIELWIATAASGDARRLEGVQLNGTLATWAGSFQWMTDLKTLLVRLVPPDRGPPPRAPGAPGGPNVQESSGGLRPSSTYEVRDVLKNPHDEDLFDYYARSQLALVDATTGAITRLGRPAVYGLFSRSPSGQYILVERIHHPYSYLHTFERFAKEVEVWGRNGELVYKLASLPLADQVAIRGVATGARQYSWLSTEADTLIWAEALDGGDPRKKVPYRDQARILRAPFTSPATDLFKTEERLVTLNTIEKGTLALVGDFDVTRHWKRMLLVDISSPAPKLELLWELSSDDRYKDPGNPVLRVLPNGVSAVRQEDGWIYFGGVGGSPDGDRPFLDRFNLRSRTSQRLFRSDKSSYESFVAWVDPARGELVTHRESPRDPPNYFARTLTSKAPPSIEAGEPSVMSSLRPITKFPDPAPQLRRIKKQLVKYKRPDGVDLSFTLYLPPDYKPGTRLPTVFYAYPLDYTEAEVAGQVQGSTQQFTMFTGYSHLFFLLTGYAVLDRVAMPIVGPSLTAYDTYLEQLVADAKAAVDRAVDIGVTDRDRIGVIGHSHGALMTANLLAHSDLFRAGVARSGAYNKSLTVFGFQNERRPLFEALDTYVKVSPLFSADKIKQPILLIHGEADFNPGTIPPQSEWLYEAIRGTGGTARLVMLPYESHGYLARESVEHTLYEMLSWFDRYVKEASPRTQKASAR
jgi:dipeptidyl aminopeptidase/acylaminoacyl peptidase